MVEHELTTLSSKIVSSGYLPDKQRDTLLNDWGYEILSNKGNHRIVFATGHGTVVKIAREDIYVGKNEKEVNIWNDVEGTGAEDLFCPVLDHGPNYNWIRMPLCERTPGRFDEYIEKLKETQWRISDCNSRGIGVLQSSGLLVCFDYPGAYKL